MRFGYVSNALRLDCKTSRHFRLASWSERRFIETVAGNLECLKTTLEFNAEHGLLFFRFSSDLIPFASHPVCTVDWRRRFLAQFRALGEYIRAHDMRISMHPGQFVILNSTDAPLFERSAAELRYHAALLDAMELAPDAIIQIHVGGLYDSKEKAMDRFCVSYERLDPAVRSRLAIENDDGRYSLADCMSIHRRLGIPVVFDTLHHQCRNEGEPLREALAAALSTWSASERMAMIDYSTQQPGSRPGTHADALDKEMFRRFLSDVHGLDFDIMFEIRDKEASALSALAIYRRTTAGAQ